MFPIGEVELGIVTSGTVKPITLFESAVYANEKGFDIVTSLLDEIVQLSEEERVINESRLQLVVSLTWKSSEICNSITDSTGKLCSGTNSTWSPVTLDTIGLSEVMFIVWIDPAVAVYVTPELIIAVGFCELSLISIVILLVVFVLVGFSMEAKSRSPRIPELL